MQCLTLVLNFMWKSRNQFMKAYQKMLRKLCLEICPKVYFVSLMYGFGTLVSRFITGKLWKSIGAYKIISRVKCWYNLIFLYFFVEIFITGVQKGREGKVQTPFPSPFERLLIRLFLVLILTLRSWGSPEGFSILLSRYKFLLNPILKSRKLLSSISI